MKDSPRFAPTLVRQLQPETDWSYGFARVAYRHSQRRSASVVMPRMAPLCLATARSPLRSAESEAMTARSTHDPDAEGPRREPEIRSLPPRCNRKGHLA